jgi:uncharacterized membrane protein
MFDLTTLHPLIIHFPIALLIVGLIADITGAIWKKEFYSRAGFYLLITGTLGVIAAYFSGNYASEGLIEAGSLKYALETHESAATLTLWTMIIVSVVRIVLVALKKFKGVLQWVSVFLFLLGALSIVRTGHLGGQLVYRHAAGVRLQIDTAPAAEVQMQESSGQKTADTD